ncbi:MAG: 2-C-methyl-D-erythritol 4-phosphate cytidylyltransferase [Coriobacteriia bacterium]|nr:2-C-methyl-D-erythritol 4-phosphate cytidylyltransferase [Coriobacteriia bacterium]
MTDGADQPAVVALIVAGGTGERFGREDGKQLAEAGCVPVLGHTVRAFDRAGSVDAIIVVAHPEQLDEYRAVAGQHVEATRLIGVVPGGDTRQDSVRHGLAAVPASARTIIVHDGARPLVAPEVIDSAVTLLESSPDSDGVVVGHPAFDTLKIVDGNRVVATPDRGEYWVAQTPQVFRAAALRSAYSSALEEGLEGTDDASLVEAVGGRVVMLEGSRDNLKVTVAEDLAVIEALLANREGE